jgi:hypothetical protein
VTEHDVLVGYRLRLFTLAEELGNVSRARRLTGVHRPSYYHLKKQVGNSFTGSRSPARRRHAARLSRSRC